MKVKVSVLQYEVPDGPDMEIKKLQEMISQAVWTGAQLVVAPETALGELAKVKEDGVDRKSEMVQLAKDNKVFLCTSYYVKENEKIFNQGLIVDDEGNIVLEHKKIYLAPPERESGISGGDTLKVAGTKIGKLGMLICKDGFTKYSHFLYQKLNDLGVEIICAPTWSIGWKNSVGNDEYVKGLYVYGSFISRAYILMSGNLNKSTESFGRSLIVSPVKGVLKEASRDKKEILSEEIDLDEVKRIREFDSWWQPTEEVKLK